MWGNTSGSEPPECAVYHVRVAIRIAEVLINAMTRLSTASFISCWFSCDYRHQFKTSVRTDVYCRVNCAFHHLSDTTGKLVTGREFQSAVFGCQSHPWCFDQRDDILALFQFQRFCAVVGDDGHESGVVGNPRPRLMACDSTALSQQSRYRKPSGAPRYRQRHCPPGRYPE